LQIFASEVISETNEPVFRIRDTEWIRIQEGKLRFLIEKKFLCNKTTLVWIRIRIKQQVVSRPGFSNNLDPDPNSATTWIRIQQQPGSGFSNNLDPGSLKCQDPDDPDPTSPPIHLLGRDELTRKACRLISWSKKTKMTLLLILKCTLLLRSMHFFVKEI